MRSRNKNAGKASTKALEEFMQPFKISSTQCRKARERRSPMTIE